MSMVTLGSTGICVNKNGFGALPVQRVTKEDAVYLLRKAYDGGIRFFDTARAYSDSEEKLGAAFEEMREKVFISTKTMAKDVEGFWKDLETSLSLLKTDYIDIYQFHNPSFCPKPGDGTGLYEAMLEAKAQGKIRHIGITNHRMSVAEEIIESGLYETLQFPFCYLATDREKALVQGCKEKNIGFIAMKALSGGLITNSAAAYAFEDQYDNVLPIWGVQREKELDEFLSYIACPPAMTDEIKTIIEKDQKELSGNFCRGCGYCMPCPRGVDIPGTFRCYNAMYSEGKKSGRRDYLQCTAFRKNPASASQCVGCGKCEQHCPQHIEIRGELKAAAGELETVKYKFMKTAIGVLKLW